MPALVSLPRRIAWTLALLAVVSIGTAALATVAAAGALPRSTGASAGVWPQQQGGDAAFRLTVLHNNDGESALLPGDDQGGVARFSWLVLREKARAVWRTDGYIMVSSGDNFLASPAYTASVSDGRFYDALALDMIGYDAIDLGNHDFDFGPDVLADFITEGFRQPGTPPYLSSNLDFSGEPELEALVSSGAIAGSTIVSENGELIGIVGGTTPTLPFISSPRNIVVLQDVAAEIQTEIDGLIAQGVNKIIVISHLQSVEEDLAIAAQLSGVDVMVAGGGDELLANADTPLLPGDQADEDGDGLADAVYGSYPLLATNADGQTIPVVTTSGQYGYLGRLVVDFDAEGNVLGFEGDPLRVVSRAVGTDGIFLPDPQMEQAVEAPVEAFVAALDANTIASSEVELDGRRDPVRSRETNEGNLIADAELFVARNLAADFGVGLPVVALQNGGGIRNDAIIPAGEITELDSFDMVPFPNFVSVVEGVSRAQFLALLENAVSQVNADGDPEGSGTGRFAQVAGFSFSYSSSAEPFSRVVDVTLDDGTKIVVGGALQAGDPLNIATIDFSARGGDEYDFGGAGFTPLGVSYQQAVADYIQSPNGLNGVISAADYPEGGAGRITRIP